MDYLSFMEQAIKSKFPKLCNKPVMTDEIEKKSFTLLKLKIPVPMTSYL
jgi:hypothetical protein